MACVYPEHESNAASDAGWPLPTSNKRWGPVTNEPQQLLLNNDIFLFSSWPSGTWEHGTRHAHIDSCFCSHTPQKKQNIVRIMMQSIKAEPVTRVSPYAQ